MVGIVHAPGILERVDAENTSEINVNVCPFGGNCALTQFVILIFFTKKIGFLYEIESFW